MTTLSHIFLAFVLLLLQGDLSEAISCLVIRPGFGLVSEPCPRLAVACRIRIEADHIVWYEYSKLYDRNKLVCVLPDEYNTKEQKTGCVKKPSGALRCWCSGQSNCNNPASSRDLYFAFQSGDAQEMREVATEIENGDFSDYESFDAETKLQEEDVVGNKLDGDGRVPITKVEISARQKTSSTSTSTPTPTTTSTTTRRPTTGKAVKVKEAVKTSSPPPIFTSHEEVHPLPKDADDYEKTKYQLENEMKEEARLAKEFLEDEEKEMRDEEAESKELADLQEDHRQTEEEGRKSFKEHMEKARIDQQRYLEQQREQDFARTTEISRELPRDLAEASDEEFDEEDEVFPFLDPASSTSPLSLSSSLLLFLLLL